MIGSIVSEIIIKRDHSEKNRLLEINSESCFVLARKELPRMRRKICADNAQRSVHHLSKNMLAARRKSDGKVTRRQKEKRGRRRM